MPSCLPILTTVLSCIILACGADGSAPSASAGSGGIGGGTLTSGGGGTTSGSSGAGGTSTVSSTCQLGCRNARACLTNGELCPNVTAADGEAIEAGCLEICAVGSDRLEAISEDATRCGLALSMLIDSSDLATRPNRDAIERCAPSSTCESACDTVGACGADRCENLGVNAGNLFGACIPRCAADESWAADIEVARSSGGCTAVLRRYAEEAPGDLPAGCPAP